ncbi:MAG: C40 family peptidase, partial [Butyrivibrio sp.]|nr:C40 family peptidase [Butyrivibrio sp.]
YDDYENALDEGVNFYDEPEPSTYDNDHPGCETDYESYNADYDTWTDAKPEWTDYAPDIEDYYDDDGNLDSDSYDADYDAAKTLYDSDHSTWESIEPVIDDYKYCPGHSALSCSYGYRDINIYVTVITKEDIYKAFDNGMMLTYKVPDNYEEGTFETKKVHLDIDENSFNPEYTKVFFDEGGFSEDSNIEWCENLYDQDFYDLYGIDAYTDSVSLPSGKGAMSKAQIDEILETIDYDDLSVARKEFVSFALSYVGKISYYWGGKPVGPGWDINNFGSFIKADYMGRTSKGLDCSGFVSWCYWSVITPDFKKCPTGTSTANFTSSLGLSQISADRLKPGDIGLQNVPGSKSNHIGIFAGYDESGRAKWVHCSGAPTNNVVCNTTNGFRLYYSLFND